MNRPLYLVRHGETTYNASGRMQGQLDTELSERGHAQARQAAELLADVHITRIVASDLNRAATTAGYIAERLGLEVTTDSRLRETHLGDWQGMARSEVDAQYPGSRAQWRNDATWTPPGGESRVDVCRRIRPVVDELMEEYSEWDDGGVLLVAHNGAISALACALLDLEVGQFPMLSSLKNTHWAKLVARPAFDPAADRRAPRFADAADARSAQWFLEGWNMGRGD